MWRRGWKRRPRFITRLPSIRHGKSQLTYRCSSIFKRYWAKATVFAGWTQSLVAHASCSRRIGSTARPSWAKWERLKNAVGSKRTWKNAPIRPFPTSAIWECKRSARREVCRINSRHHMIQSTPQSSSALCYSWCVEALPIMNQSIGHYSLGSCIYCKVENKRRFFLILTLVFSFLFFFGCFFWIFFQFN